LHQLASDKGAQGVGDGLVGGLVMMGEMAGSLDDVLGRGLDSLPPIAGFAESCYCSGHALPIDRLLDIESALEGPEDLFGVVGKLPGLRVLGVADYGEGFFGEAFFGLFPGDGFFDFGHCCSFGRVRDLPLLLCS